LNLVIDGAKIDDRLEYLKANHMNGFDQITDNEFFNGSKLLQICIGSNEISLNFYPNFYEIQILNVNLFMNDNKFLFVNFVCPDFIINQFDQTVVKLTILDTKTAVITLSDLSEIILRDDSPNYESVVFRYGEKKYIVV
jgi:hypothetical protein